MSEFRIGVDLGGTKTEVIAKAAHNYNAATCTEAKTCKACGVTSGSALGHAYDNDCDTGCNRCGATRTVPHSYSHVHDESCDWCGATRKVQHVYSNVCDAKCNSCPYIRTAPHSYKNATCTAPKTCTACGITVGNAFGHKSDNGTVTKKATCTATGTKTYKCTACKATLKTEVIAKVAHNYNAATCTTAKTCKACGATSGKKLGHTYTNSCDTTCNRCKVSRSITHSYKTTTTKATLSKNGSIVKKCTVCGKVASKTTIRYAKTIKLSKTSYTYDGKVKKPTVTVKDSAGKTISSKYYTVTYASGRKNAGTYKVTVKMKGNYIGTKTLTFKILPVSISKCKLKLSATSYTYNGKVKTPSVTVKNANGSTLKKGTHYTVTYATGRKNVGTYKVTVKMKGNYSGTKTLTFKINPPKTTVSKVTPAKKSLKVTLTKKTSQVTGYQVQYSTSKTFKSVKTKTISSYKTTSTTLSSLKAKTTYYVRVRTYKTVNGTKYYSGWSTAKSAKTK